MLAIIRRGPGPVSCIPMTDIYRVYWSLANAMVNQVCHRPNTVGLAIIFDADREAHVARFLFSAKQTDSNTTHPYSPVQTKFCLFLCHGAHRRSFDRIFTTSMTVHESKVERSENRYESMKHNIMKERKRRKHSRHACCVACLTSVSSTIPTTNERSNDHFHL